ncbi:nitrite reductase small subunit NirD [Thalassotalea agarivorans]|uniref:Assimilatory nitrite reductase (NAD(P)H) small subunit n=1 Tax=Thalassotalea agarivorans TaxID=349064 RepID=A0A1I0CV30_THASX|nr:nitrite reductase small subunit NirD [Thalassotalea agarivorans]SET22962.1 assimilatory nitrite reductase (NAD(P)H) small subunit [Thalassotalea agarivorans]
MGIAETKQWHDICDISALVENTGVAALLPNQQQIALFKITGLEPDIFAIGNFDPIGKANVLYRGIVGSAGEEPIVASPLYKQHFSLRSGECIQQPDQFVPVYPVRTHSDRVQVFF